MNKSAALARLLWLLAGLALALGWLREPLLDLLPAPRALARLDGAAGRPWLTGGFSPQTIAQGQLPKNIEHASSWLGSDDWQGTAETAWFKTNRRTVYVAVAGYPSHPDCSLIAEFRDAHGATTRVSCDLKHPREEWSLWEIRRPAGAVAVRLLAADDATGWCGWFAFSHPFRAPPPELTAAYQFAQLLATTALVLTLLWGPGLLWCPANARPTTRLLYFLAAGPLVLAALGALVWLAGGIVRPQLLAVILVSLLWLVIGQRARRRAFALDLTPGLARALALTVLIVVAIVAKSAHSRGPEGELFRGTISRNYELGDRIDSRFSFYAVQAAALHQAPWSPITEKRYFPWTFFSRGPLAGLGAIPVVLAVNSHPPEKFPDERFSPFDRTGFAPYRITLIVLASGIIVALFLLLLPLVGETWALTGAGLLALTPFGLHEIFFTWPKWAATAWLIASFALAHERRPAAAGLALGVGFLFHPLALLWSPWIGLWATARAYEHRRLAPAAFSLLRCAAGAAALVLPWMALGVLMPHLPDTPLAGQGGFLRYWLLADWQPATWETWWRTRWLNFANTFLPLHLAFDASSFDHFKLDSAYEVSAPLPKLTQLWWTSLPFALGLALWAVSLVAFARLCQQRALRLVALLFVFLPSLFIVAYWGMDPLGLMRECLHPIFVAVLALLVVLAARHAPRLARVLGHRAAPFVQLPEAFLVLWLAPLLNPRPWAAAYPHFDDAYLALSLLALLSAAVLLARHRPALASAALPVSPSPRLPVSLRLIFACAVAALLLGPARFDRVIPSVLRPAIGDTQLPAGSFKPDGFFLPAPSNAVPPGVATLGSWLQTDEFQGEHTTHWFLARPEFTILLAGYPAQAPNRLELEIHHRDHSRTTLAYQGPNPREAWQPWLVRLPQTAAQFRIRAVDGSSATFGWLAFSEPYNDVSKFSRQLWPLLPVACITCLSLVLLQGPGLLWLRQRARQPRDLAVALVFGPLLLAVLGLACWLLGGWLAPATTARLGTLALLAWLGWRAYRQEPYAAPLPDYARPVLLAGACLVGFAVAKSTLSLGPAGELFHGTVSRTLAVGGHSDSRISYHAVQLIAGHHGPFSPAAESLYSPWSFANRGPLASLIAAPIVLATGGQPTLDATHQPWEPFDRQGFAAYRIALIALASLVAWAVFAAAATVLPAPWALFTAALALLTPFFVHELYFTWPKLATATFVLATFSFAHRHRPIPAALLLGIAYLFHPLALFSAPFLALWLLRPSSPPLPVSPSPRPLLRRLTPAVLFCATLAPIVLAWMLLGRLAPLRTGAQSVFFDYFRLASGTLPATAADWWFARWSNFANTFLPLHLFSVDRAHESINSVYFRSDPFVQAAFLYWNTLPFALGLPAFAFLLPGLFAAFRRAFAATAVLYLLPTLLTIFYWGAASTGLMRHCGHVLFLSTLLLGAWAVATHLAPSFRAGLVNAFLHPATFALRAFEILLVAFGTTLLHRRPDPSSPFFASDLLCLILAATFLAAAVFMLAKSTRSLRSSLS